MHDVANAGTWIDVSGALVMALLGAFMLTVRPRRNANLAFALFAIGFGAFFIARNLGNLLLDVRPPGAPPGLALSFTAILLCAIAGSLWVASAFPSPLARGERRLLALPLATGATALLLVASVVHLLVGTAQEAVFVLAFVGMAGVLSGLPAFYALRAARSSSGATQRQFAILASAFALYAGFIATAGSPAERSTSILDPSSAPYLAVGGLAPMLLAVVLWLRAAATVEASRAARNTALLCAAMPLLGLLYVAYDQAWGALGLVRIGMVAVLAYGIARHQLLGLDLKVRWTISKSTVAAVFIAVFFVTSELAQQFFGDTLGGTYVGIAAAGALVFAIAPLQRMAERLAEKAVPVAGPRPDGAAPLLPDARDAAYRRAVRIALRDRRLTRDEELHLIELAHHVGITPLEASRIHAEVEQEVRG